MNRLMQAMAFLSLCVLISGCEDKKAKEALTSAQDMARDAGARLEGMLAQGKAAVLAAARNQIADLDQGMSDFKERASTLSADAKAELQEGIKSLELGAASLKQKLEPMTNAQGEGWKEIAKEFDVVVAQMRKTIADIRSKMK